MARRPLREARHTASCPTCRESAGLGARLRGLPVAPMSAEERARVWNTIGARLTHPPRDRRLRLAHWARGLGRRRPAVVWAPAVATAAAAVLLVLAPLRVGDRWEPFAPAHLDAHTVIERVDAGDASSVLLFETGARRLPIIWVTEPAPAPETR